LPQIGTRKEKNILTVWKKDHIIIHLTFEWNENKNQDNIQKHFVSFEIAQEAFFDKNRIILKDKKHSKMKNVYFALEMTGMGS